MAKLREKDYSLRGLQRLAKQYYKKRLQDDKMEKTTRMEKTISKDTSDSLKDECIAYVEEGIKRGSFTHDQALDVVYKLDQQDLSSRKQKMKGKRAVARTIGGAVAATLLTALILWASHNTKGPESTYTETTDKNPIMVFDSTRNPEQEAERRSVIAAGVSFETGLMESKKAHEDAQHDAAREAWEKDHGSSR